MLANVITGPILFCSLRPCLPQAIVHHGGFAATAAALGWSTQRRQRRAWADEQAVAAELRRFILQTHSAGQGRPDERRGGAGKPAMQRRRASPGVPGEEGEDAAALPPGAKMPTHRELLAAGRHDLRSGLPAH